MMKRHLSYVLLALGITAAAVACDDDEPTGPQPELFRAVLNGANEHPARTTPATGTADFSYLNDVLTWSIDLDNITNVTAAHIHLGTQDVASGGVILGLTPGTSGVNNNLITGSITRANYTPAQGQSFDQLLALMRNGGAYVNVHTNLTTNDPTNNTGPGDFPGGEIRGQITLRP